MQAANIESSPVSEIYSAHQRSKLISSACRECLKPVAIQYLRAGILAAASAIVAMNMGVLTVRKRGGRGV